MMPFYVVMVNATPGLTVHDVQDALGTEHAWYRIANNLWIVRTYMNPDELQDLLVGCVRPAGTLFISELNPRNRQGWMPQEFWNWLNGQVRRR